ncbi:MAG: twin-arginine translocase TatA/TatE family subunit [Kiritimatiellia bacterium]
MYLPTLAFIGLGESCGSLEVLLIIAVILIIFGPKSLPELVRKFSRAMSMMRRAADDFKNQIMEMDQPPYKEPKDFYASSPYPGQGVDIDGVPALTQPSTEESDSLAQAAKAAALGESDSSSSDAAADRHLSPSEVSTSGAEGGHLSVGEVGGSQDGSLPPSDAGGATSAC